MTLSEIAKRRDPLNEALDETSAELNRVCRNYRSPNGLVNATFKTTSAYKTAKENFDAAFNALRDFNAELTNKQKRALRKYK